MRGPFTPDAPQLDGVVGVTIGTARQLSCGAVLVTSRLALSIASCFLVTPLSEQQQISCLRGPCEGAVVDPTEVRLIGGPDVRIGAVVARVTRIAVRFTASWAIPMCTRALCGEGWDVALLSIDPSCEHGPMSCLPPLRVATVPAAIGVTPLGVGFGGNPSYNRRDEFQLELSANGSGVRRTAPARVWLVASRQRLTIEALGDDADGDRRGPFCQGDLGAALVSQRGGVWEVDGMHVPSASPPPPFDWGAAACARPQADAWSVHAARCWIEAAARKWDLPPVVPAHAAECAGLDFYPPEVNFAYLGAGGAAGGESSDGDALAGALAATAGGGIGGNCSTLSCELGVCVDGTCSCANEVYGPRCTLRGPPPQVYTALDTIVVAPHGADGELCGSAREPCRTLRHALARQFWQYYGGLASGLRWEYAGIDAPSGGGEVEITNARLAAALVTRTVFTPREVAAFGLGSLRATAYIQRNGDGEYYRPVGGGLASITLLEGTYAGEGMTGLVLHGVDVAIRSLRGPEHSLIDCRDERDGAHGMLFLRGAHAGVEVSGLTLRKCLVEEQIHAALAAHPQHFAHVAGPARAPPGRDGARFRGVRWLAT